jgi:uncharacterized protein (DUF427 family)
MTRQHLEPGPDHPITITPTAGRVSVKVDGRTIADTTNALTLQEASYPAVQYVPLADVDPDVLVQTDTQTYCPFKGEASYYSVRTDDGEVTDAIWTYEQPYPAVVEIKEHAAFYPDKVEIIVEG